MLYPRFKPYPRPSSSPAKHAASVPKEEQQQEQQPSVRPASSTGERLRSKSPTRDIFQKSRVDQSLHLMKLIYKKEGEEFRPNGHSQFDALGCLKSEVAYSLLRKKKWSDFFEELKEANSLSIVSEEAVGAGANSGREKSHDDIFRASTSNTLQIGDRSIEEIRAEKMDSFETFRYLKKRVNNLWNELKVPATDRDFYGYMLLRECSYTLEQFSNLSLYVTTLNNYRGSTIAVLNEISNREFIVTRTLEFLSQLKRRSNVNDVRQKLLASLQQVQICTVNVVHQIQNWRANFWRPLPFQ
jgi:hypothetical protein